MSAYDFSTLNDKDFEEIVCDLLSAELKIPFQSFKEGKDGGVDLKYSTEINDNEIVVQVKHYINTPKAELFRTLKTKELNNLKALKPEKYIVATSIPLNPDDKRKIKENLKPYVKSSQDIIGRNDLNRLLRKHDSVEEKHFKLWFNNTKVLSKILNNGISGRSEFVADKIKKNIELFVKTESFDEAWDILNKERVLLITGIPGIGKTTLSYILSYYFLAHGFELIFCENDFSEAESMIGDTKKKQIFLFDDFLGDSYLEIQSGKNKTINSFIERIRVSKSKFMILTTRTTILKQAQEIHEKIDRINFNSNNFELKISDYNELHKAQILYNHLFFLKVDKQYIKELLNDKSYLKIIRHASYNPRLLEFITNTDHFIPEEFEESYLKFCLHNLDFPKAVWEKPFWNQLDLYERDVLFCLLSIGRNVDYESLEVVYNEKINRDIQQNRKQYKPNSFTTSFKILLNGYIKSTTDRNGRNSIDFINPSLKDFIIQYFNDNPNEKRSFSGTFHFIEQYSTFYSKAPVLEGDNISFDNKDLILVFNQLKNKEIKSVKTDVDSEINILVSAFLDKHHYEFYKQGVLDKIADFQLSILKNVDWDNVGLNYMKMIFSILENVDVESELGDYLKSVLIEKLDKILGSIVAEYDLETLKGIEDKFQFNIINVLNESSKLESLKNCIQRIYMDLADDYYPVYSADVEDHRDFERASDKIWEIQFELSSKYFEDMDLEFDYNPIIEKGFDEIREANLQAQYDASIEWSDYEESREKESFESDVESLFSRFENR